MFKFLLILLIISTSQVRAKDDNEDSLIQLVCTGELVMTFPFSSKPSKVFSYSPLGLMIFQRLLYLKKMVVIFYSSPKKIEMFTLNPLMFCSIEILAY